MNVKSVSLPTFGNQKHYFVICTRIWHCYHSNIIIDHVLLIIYGAIIYGAITYGAIICVHVSHSLQNQVIVTRKYSLNSFAMKVYSAWL